MGAAVSWTTSPYLYGPAGTGLTVPPLGGLEFMVSVTGLAVKVAVTNLSPFMVMVVGLVVPVRSWLHPANEYPVIGVAVS